MESLTVQVERWNDVGIVRSFASDEAKTEVVRPIDYNILEGTCVPADYQIRAGALVSLMMHFPLRTVSLIELRAFRNGDLWVADALVDDGDQNVVCRRCAATPVEALVALSVEIQEY